ncbi:ATP-binding protein [Actinocorallia sp. API 0066]|uniref:ATP-binding protein n=1 Tax=Actinocorallia sp. API 0066 TaxID=2896846 RepID=UPI001E39E2A5|nr:ATP-binding protein [Actinocorallia sp. API 0066]MCD0449098.1 ATP-binding protein [Actinocorallia sp. API 0066]
MRLSSYDGVLCARPTVLLLHAVESTCVLRAVVRRVAEVHRLSAGATMRLVTATEEIAVNAVRHGVPPVTATVRVESRAVRTTVHDHGTEVWEEGFGLGAVRRLADEVSVSRRHGTTVSLAVYRHAPPPLAHPEGRGNRRTGTFQDGVVLARLELRYPGWWTVRNGEDVWTATRRDQPDKSLAFATWGELEAALEADAVSARHRAARAFCTAQSAQSYLAGGPPCCRAADSRPTEARTP